MWPITQTTYKQWNDSFSFAKGVLEFAASIFMAAFDVKSLFNNIPLTGTLNFGKQNLYRGQTHVCNLTKSSFYSLLKITMFESFFYIRWKILWTMKVHKQSSWNNFESFIPDMYKRGFTGTVLHRSFRLCSSYDNFHREIETLKSVFKSTIVIPKTS